jgi:hypothetical protein
VRGDPPRRFSRVKTARNPTETARNCIKTARNCAFAKPAPLLVRTSVHSAYCSSETSVDGLTAASCVLYLWQPPLYDASVVWLSASVVHFLKEPFTMDCFESSTLYAIALM